MTNDKSGESVETMEEVPLTRLDEPKWETLVRG